MVKSVLCAGIAASVVALGGLEASASGVVSFRDAAKIRSWDAWDDHKARAAVTNVLQKEKRSVTWARLNAVDPGLHEIGRLQTRTSDQVKSSKWSVGCETLDRDYADWDSYKDLLPMLGVKRARFFSGWAKTEQEKGVYDFAWLERQVRECAAMGVTPWVCLSYGNPVWGSDFRLGMRVKQVTDDPDAFAAWLRYVKALVARCGDVVDTWEIWNEPFNQAEAYAELFYRTAKAVREVQPSATIVCAALAMDRDMSRSDYAVVLECRPHGEGPDAPQRPDVGLAGDRRAARGDSAGACVGDDVALRHRRHVLPSGAVREPDEGAAAARLRAVDEDEDVRLPALHRPVRAVQVARLARQDEGRGRPRGGAGGVRRMPSASSASRVRSPAATACGGSSATRGTSRSRRA